MHGTSFVYFIFIVFAGAAVLATLALFTRQSLLVAYILLGVLLGPSGIKLVPDLALSREIGDVGIIFLLFLLGLDLSPKDLIHTIRKSILATIISSVIFAVIGFCIGHFFGFTVVESLLIGTALMFSSTIIGLKLLPAQVLHHRATGELVVSVLLIQDLLAILLLLFIHGASMTGSKWIDMSLAAITLPALLAVAFLLQRFMLVPLFQRFAQVKEYVFLLALGWCLGLAELGTLMGLPAEIGAFIGGIAIAQGPIATYIAESLKPLRDFCLVLFFFAIGASFDLSYLPQIWLPAVILAGTLLFAKPWVFRWLLEKSGVSKRMATEVGLRLGQGSEFSLLLAYLAVANTSVLISDKANYLIQATTLFTFIVSSYLVVLRYPTPMAFTDRLRRD